MKKFVVFNMKSNVSFLRMFIVLTHTCTAHDGNAELDEFNNTIKTLVDVMDGQAKRIERAKLKAIGQRNKVDSEEGNRKRRKEELRAQINEDLTDLERLREEHDSLNAVELEQKSLIEKLSNNA